MFNHLKNFFKLVRWFHELLAIFPFVGLYFVIAYYVQKSGTSCELQGIDFLILCFCVQLLLAAGCVLNDIVDRDIDRINKPNTHIVGRAISLKNCWLIFGVLTLLAVLFSVYITLFVFKEWAIISMAVYILSIAYDVYLKRSPLFGNILMGLLASFIPLVLFFFAKECIDVLHNEKINVLIWIYCLFPFAIIVPRELSLDISDMEGDKACGCKTLPIVIGVKHSKIVVLIMLLLVVLISLPVMLFYPHLMVSFALTDPLLLVYLYWMWKCELRIEYIRAGRFLWLVMIVGLIAFTLSTIYS